MIKWQTAFPLGYKLFLKIAEPRIVRLGFFGVYLFLISTGFAVLLRPPRSIQHVELVLGATTLVWTLGVFLTLGGIASALAVLPGIWWLERTGIFMMGAGMALFAVFTAGPYASIACAFILIFALRWREIRRYQLAPLEIVEPRKE